MNRISGIKTRLNSDPNPAGPMKEKTKTNWEHFYNNLFTINLQKKDTEQTYTGIKQARFTMIK